MRATGEIRSILCVHQGSELYGSDRSFLQSVKSLRRCYPQARIRVILPSRGLLLERLQGVADDILVRELAVLRREAGVRGLFSCLMKLPRRIRRARDDCRNEDLVYINTLVVLDFIFASYGKGRRFVIHVRETPGFLVRLGFSLLLAPSRAGLIFNSRFTRRAYALVGWKSARVIHNAAEDYDDVGPLSVGHGKLKILHLGRFNSMKGQELLLDAIAGLSAEERQQVEVRIVGSEYGRQERNTASLRRRITLLGLQEQVEMLGFAPYPDKLFAWADVVVISSTRPESFGRVAIEAMSARRCVVAANHGGLPEIVTPFVDGLLFQANDAGDLRACLRQLLEDRKMLRQLAERGWLKYRRCFTEDNYESEFSRYIMNAPAG